MTAKEMADAFGVSERTARRHIARGTTPERTRKVGRDGKTYPGLRDAYPHSFRPGRPSGPLAADLTMARNAVRRLARAAAFSPDDLAEMRTIASEAGDLLREWTIAVEAAQHAQRAA